MPEPENPTLLGRLAVHYKLISMDQLAEATREQARRGGRTTLGEVLLELGHLQPSQLQQLVVVQKEVLARRAAEAKPNPPAEAPAASPSAGTNAAARPLAPAPVRAQSGPPAGREPRSIEDLLREAVRLGASDVHVHAGAKLRLRLHGRFVDHGSETLDESAARELVHGLLSDAEREALERDGELDLCHTLPGVARFRVNVFRQQRGVDAVLRVIPLEPPSLAGLGLPQGLARFTNFHQGMVLVTGPAGCGKSSTLAALVHLINEERREHVLTIEDPIEYVHTSKRCLVNQRNVRRHTESFARALRAGLREDPDVIVIGELRDLETISLALTAAETGHFVLATLHTNDTIRTINRLVGAFPPDQQDQVRTMISESLRAVISQRLVRTATNDRRVPALEVLVVNKAVGNLIRENKTFQIRSILQTGVAQGMITLDQSLAQLVQQGVVSREEAARLVEDPKKLGGAVA
ncbi:Twitching mobility protein [Myxococcaceae bacterium]|jgi:twitching motility protein PilT|nr:Twitching mobility protein [Myxococcaceae bacterium]